MTKRSRLWRGVSGTVGATCAIALFVAIAQVPAEADEPAVAAQSAAGATSELGPEPQVNDSAQIAVEESFGGVEAVPEALDALLEGSAPLDDGVAVDNGVITELPQGSSSTVTSVSVESSEAVTFDVVGAGDFQAAGDAVVASDVDADTRTVVHATDRGGVQIVYVAETPEAPDSFTVESAVPDGYTWEPQADGSLRLVSADADADPLMVVDAPWALDANGRRLPTYFEVDGGTITQRFDTTGAAFPVVADPAWWWWAGTTIACVAEIALIAVGGAKVVAAFAKAEKIIKASRALIRAYNWLGGKMSKVFDYVRKYVKDKASLTKTQIRAVEDLFSSIGATLVNLLGVGKCWELIKELRD